jgi:hypothetical protein
MANILGRTYWQVNTPGRARETCLTGAWLAESSFILVLDSSMEGVYPLVVRERVRNGTKRKGIEAFLLERNG